MAERDPVGMGKPQMRFLIDSNVWIEAAANAPHAIKAFQYAVQGSWVGYSAITRLELFGYPEKCSWESWILFNLDAVQNTAVFTRQRILAIRELMTETMERAKKELPSRVYSKELIELLFHQPYTKGQFLVDAGIAERKTAAEYLKSLEKIGILKSKNIGRETLYLNTKLYELLSK